MFSVPSLPACGDGRVALIEPGVVNAVVANRISDLCLCGILICETQSEVDDIRLMLIDRRAEVRRRRVERGRADFCPDAVKVGKKRPDIFLQIVQIFCGEHAGAFHAGNPDLRWAVHASNDSQLIARDISDKNSFTR